MAYLLQFPTTSELQTFNNNASNNLNKLETWTVSGAPSSTQADYQDFVKNGLSCKAIVATMDNNSPSLTCIASSDKINLVSGKPIGNHKFDTCYLNGTPITPPGSLTCSDVNSCKVTCDPPNIDGYWSCTQCPTTIPGALGLAQIQGSLTNNPTAQYISPPSEPFSFQRYAWHQFQFQIPGQGAQVASVQGNNDSLSFDGSNNSGWSDLWTKQS